MAILFGLINALSTFQVIMNKMFRPYLQKFLAVFFENMLVYNKSKGEHLQHLQITLSILEEN